MKKQLWTLFYQKKNKNPQRQVNRKIGPLLAENDLGLEVYLTSIGCRASFKERKWRSGFMRVHSTYSVIVQESLCLFMRDVGHTQIEEHTKHICCRYYRFMSENVIRGVLFDIEMRRKAKYIYYAISGHQFLLSFCPVRDLGSLSL